MYVCPCVLVQFSYDTNELTDEDANDRLTCRSQRVDIHLNMEETR